MVLGYKQLAGNCQRRAGRSARTFSDRTALIGIRARDKAGNGKTARNPIVGATADLLGAGRVTKSAESRAGIVAGAGQAGRVAVLTVRAGRDASDHGSATDSPGLAPGQ